MQPRDYLGANICGAQVFEAQRAYTQLADREIFWNPATGRPWADIQTQWKIWRACLKR
jgi:hypothetical protein